MKVLHVLDHSLPLHSGYVFRTQGILAEQRVLGIDTFQLTSAKHSSSTRDVENVDGFCFHRTVLDNSIVDRLPGADQYRIVTSLQRRLDELVRRIEPDIIHAHSPCLNGLAALRVARRHAIPFVYEMRASWEDAAVSHGTTREGSFRYILSKALETFVLRRADAVTTLCEGLRRDVMSRGVPEGRIAVVANAVDRNLLDDLPNAEICPSILEPFVGRRTIGFFGSFYSYEGLDLLIDALASLRGGRRDAALILLGSGPEEATLRAQVQRLGLQRDVVFFGRIPHEQVAAFYRHVDVFVFPRRRMRLTEIVTPLKPLEAMAAGALVVASDVGGHRELINDGKTGLLFNADDGTALADVLERVIGVSNDFSAVCEAGRQFVYRERTWPQVARRYLPIYQSLLQTG